MIPSDDHEDSDHHYRRCEDRIQEQIELSSSTFDPNPAEADEIVAPSSSYDDFLTPLPPHLLADFTTGLWDVNPSSSWYVYLYVHTYIHTYVYMCTYVYACMYVCMHVC